MGGVMDNPVKDGRSLNAIHCQLDMIWTDLYPVMTGDQRLRVLEAMKDLRKQADRLSDGDF